MDAERWGCMGPSAPARSTPRPTRPPASRVGPVLPRRSARAALRTSRASCPGPVCALARRPRLRVVCMMHASRQCWHTCAHRHGRTINLNQGTSADRYGWHSWLGTHFEQEAGRARACSTGTSLLRSARPLTATSTVFITDMACFLSLGDSARLGSSLKEKSSAAPHA